MDLFLFLDDSLLFLVGFGVGFLARIFSRLAAFLMISSAAGVSITYLDGLWSGLGARTGGLLLGRLCSLSQ